MSVLTRLYDDDPSSTPTQVGADLTAAAVTLSKGSNGLYYTVAGTLTKVDRIVSRVSRSDSSPVSLKITVTSGTSWRLVGTQDPMDIVGPKTDGGIRWSYDAGGSTLDIEAWYPSAPGATDIDDNEGIEWWLTDQRNPPVRLKVHVKRLTV